MAVTIGKLSKARDFSTIVDANPDVDRRGSGHNKRINVSHCAFLPKEGDAVKVHVTRESGYLAFVVKTVGLA